MKLFYISLLLASAFTWQTAEALAVDDQTLLTDTNTVLLPGPWLKILQQTDAFSIIAGQSDKDWRVRRDSFTRTENIHKRLVRIFRNSVSLITADYRFATGQASHYWQQVAAYCREFGVFPDDGCKLPIASRSVEIFQPDIGVCPELLSYSEIADQWLSLRGETYRTWTTVVPIETSSPLPAQLFWGVKYSLCELNVAFCSISHQIVQFDWTLLLAGRLSERSAKNVTPASRTLDR